MSFGKSAVGFAPLSSLFRVSGHCHDHYIVEQRCKRIEEKKTGQCRSNLSIIVFVISMNEIIVDFVTEVKQMNE